MNNLLYSIIVWFKLKKTCLVIEIPFFCLKPTDRRVKPPGYNSRLMRGRISGKVDVRQSKENQKIKKKIRS